ncbi:hypothetical protein XELAEV_18007447mg [Xenopus laevis]|uniref:L-serine deaminase n=1 Tax=Xenopus laevis TaxID=8355 RepID=A0A974E160_XENLA|nr:hypothetical protein XELAEV_18007447mg [Xenopus laevis]
MDFTEHAPFHIVTPLKANRALSKLAGAEVLMKLENVQPQAKKGCTRFVCSLGGNAGLVAAYACRRLNLPATIVVPQSTGTDIVQKLQKLQDLGADVVVTGKVWDDADAHAHQLTETPGSVYISPFNHPLVWEHFICPKVVWGSRAVLPGFFAVVGESEGGSRGTFGKTLVYFHLHSSSGVCVDKCLGAKTICDRAFECAREHKVISITVDDREAIQALEMFLSCLWSCLAAVYSGHIQRLQQEGSLKTPIDPIVIVVCDGSAIGISQLQHFKSQLNMN